MIYTGDPISRSMAKLAIREEVLSTCTQDTVFLYEARLFSTTVVYPSTTVKKELENKAKM